MPSPAQSLRSLLATTLVFTAACDAPEEKSAAETDRGDVTTVANRNAAAPAPTMRSVLDHLAALGGKPIETLSPAEARQQPTPADAVKHMLVEQQRDTMPTSLVPGVRHVDRTIRGAVAQIPARVYTPDGDGPFPVIVYFHGGGWVIANPTVYDGGARGLAKEANAVVVSVDYRLAPEHRFPAAHDDAFAAYRWALANAASINGDPKRVALAGESAGGNLAVATAMTARDQGVQMPFAVISVYPIAGRDTTTPSYTQHANAKPLNRAMMSWFFNQYARTPADRQDPRINLVGANLEGLPPTTIINAQIDPLRSEGEMLADRLRAAGVDVEQKTYDGVTHEFFGMAAVLDQAKDAQQQAGGRVRAAASRAAADPSLLLRRGARQPSEAQLAEASRRRRTCDRYSTPDAARTCRSG